MAGKGSLLTGDISLTIEQQGGIAGLGACGTTGLGTGGIAGLGACGTTGLGAGGTAGFGVCGMDGLGDDESSDTLRIFIVEMLLVFGGLFSFPFTFFVFLGFGLSRMSLL